MINDGHAVEVARALAAVGGVAMDVGLGRTGIKVELPNFPERRGLLERWGGEGCARRREHAATTPV